MLRYIAKHKCLSPSTRVYFSVMRNFTKYYTKQHEWIEVEKDVATIGITNYAQQELGEVVHVDLPSIGEQIKEGDAFSAIESVKTAADVYAPMNGSVLEINEKLKKSPNTINTNCMSQGWIVKVKADESKLTQAMEDLMSEEQYQKYLDDVKK